MALAGTVNILVTGGRGYLGRYVVDDLLRRGHTVVNYSRDLGPAPSDPLHVAVLGELADVPRLLTVIREHSVGRIIHTAAQSHPAVSREMPLATVEANVTGTCCVLEAARLCGVRRVVCFSSEAAYGHTPPGPVSESVPLRPRTPYGATKAATEMLGHAYNECFGMDVISLRVGQIYGPGQFMQEDVHDAIKAALRGEVLELRSGRDARLQLVHVTDVTNATVAACMVDRHSLDAYNIAGGAQPTYGEVLDMLAEIVGGAGFEVGAGGFEGSDEQGPFDIQAAERDLGYVPRVALRDGLADYVAWLRTAEY
jgi:UDP-glucose 4-epimerase